jgi:hypothetical protein
MLYIHYVPVGFVHVWEKAGWIKTEALEGTGHGLYSVLMKAGPHCKFDPKGEPIRPQSRASSA